MKTILLIGATSAIAEELAKCYAAQGHRLVLWGRNKAHLESMGKNLEVLGAGGIDITEIDLDNCEQHAVALKNTVSEVGTLDLAIIAHGVLPDQSVVQNDFQQIHASIHTNFLTYASLLTVLADYFESIRSGTIVSITSVAADRGRKSNYVYGSAKAGASAFTDGLRGRLAPSGVHVVNIKPGMVDTPMTQHLKKGLLFASPKTVADGILKAVSKKKATAYVPGYWRLIMFIIRSIPESIFKKTNF
jgi:decaprenylphospho-beta-D-erythro-pentofuranosid-2-ulose 2-reductase